MEIFHLSQINFKQVFKCLNHIFKTYPASEDSHHLFPGPPWICTCCHFNKHVWHVLNSDSIRMGNDLYLRWGIFHSPPPPIKSHQKTSLVVQVWRIYLPMQRTQVWRLVEDSECCRATKRVQHNYRAHTPYSPCSPTRETTARNQHNQI